MLPRPDAPATRLAYTTADMSERLAKRKAQEQFKTNALKTLSNYKPKEDKPWYEDVAGAIGGAIKTVYDNMPMSNPVSTPINMGGNAGVSMGGQGTAKSLVLEPARLAVRRAVGDITAIPRVGADSPSYTADQIREQGVARGVLGAAIDYSQFIPVVAKGAGVTGDVVNAYKLAMMERQANPFPALRGATNVIDVVPGSRLPARIVDSPAPPAPPTPATRLGNAMAQMTLDARAAQGGVRDAGVIRFPGGEPTPDIVQPPESKALLQRLQTRNDLGVTVRDIEFPPKNSQKADWYELGDLQINAGINEQQLPEHMKAVSKYFDEQYMAFHDYLRTDTITTDTIENDVALIDQLFDIVPPVTSPITLYRGVISDEYIGNIYKNLQPGQIVYDPNYLSTSVSEVKARSWIRNLPANHLLIIDAIPGTKAINSKVANSFYGRSELEMLLPRSLPLRVKSIDGNVIYLETLPYEYIDNAKDLSDLFENKNAGLINTPVGLTNTPVLRAEFIRQNVDPNNPLLKYYLDQYGSIENFANSNEAFSMMSFMRPFFNNPPAPAPPATRLAQAQTQLPRATTADMAEQLAQLQRETARAELGLNIQDIEFPPKSNPLTRPQIIDDSGYGVFPNGAWKVLGLEQYNAGINSANLPNEMNALREYFGHDYDGFQETLRNPNPVPNNVFTEKIKLIDKIFEITPPTTEKFKVFRGVKTGGNYLSGDYLGAFYRSLQPGQLIIEPGYLSTSINKDIAQEWANDFADDYLLIINVPEGSVAVNPITSWEQGLKEFDEHLNAPTEEELLFNRGTVLRIIDNDMGVIHAEIVPNYRGKKQPASLSQPKETLLKQYSYKDLAEMIADEETQRDFYVAYFNQQPDIETLISKPNGAGMRAYDLADTIVELRYNVGFDPSDYWKFREIVDQITQTPANKRASESLRISTSQQLISLFKKHQLLESDTIEFLQDNLEEILKPPPYNRLLDQ
jgi:hypothetical protein